MKQSTIDKIKVNVLSEKIRDSIKNGSLNNNLNLYRLEAAEIGLEDDDFEKLVEGAKNATVENEKSKKIMEKNKIWFYIIMVALIIAEWIFLPIGIGWKILLSLITIVLVIIVMSVIIVIIKKK